MVPTGEMENVIEFANLLYFKVGCLPMTYLGMLLGASFKSGQFGTLFWRNSNVNWLVGRGCTCQNGGG